MWNYSSTSLVFLFLVWCLIHCRGNFTILSSCGSFLVFYCLYSVLTLPDVHSLLKNFYTSTDRAYAVFITFPMEIVWENVLLLIIEKKILYELFKSVVFCGDLMADGCFFLGFLNWVWFPTDCSSCAATGQPFIFIENKSKTTLCPIKKRWCLPYNLPYV